MKTRTGLVAVVVAVLAVLLVASPVVFAEHQGGAGYGDKANKGGHEGFFKELNLTPQQQEQLKAHKAQSMEQTKQLREQMRAKRTELKTELEKPTIDRARVTAIATELKTLSAQMIDQRIENIIALKGILTPEQFQKMTAKKHEKGPWKGRGKGEGGKGTGHEGPGGEGPDTDL